MTGAEVPPKVSAGGLVYRSSDVPRFVQGRGCYLTDTTGRRYLDAEAANGTLAWGYDPGLLVEALRRCGDLPALPSFCESELRLRVVERLADLVSDVTGRPGRVELDLGGAQAMETALRIAFAAKGPGTVLVFEGSFHGRSGITSMLSSSPRYRETLAAWGLEVVRLPSPDCRTCPHRGAVAAGSCAPGCRDAVTRWGSEVSGVGGSGHRRRVTAMVFEPVQNVAGMVEHDHARLAAAVGHAREQGAVVIADEIFTGMHRVGPRWGFQRSGVEPDVVVASKGLTNGAAAASMIWAREPLAHPSTYRPGSHSATYLGVPHALAVLDTVLDRWEGWVEVEADVAALAAGLSGVLEDAAARHGEVVEEVGVMGAAARLVLRRPEADRLRALLRSVDPDAGVLVATTGMAPDVINLHPPLVTGADELAVLGRVLGRALTALEAETRTQDGPGALGALRMEVAR